MPAPQPHYHYIPQAQARAVPLGAPFAPSMLFGSGEQGFAWDISNTANLFQERTGAAATTAATANTNPVGSVKDISGNGNWFTVPTSDAKRPLLDIASTLKSLSFDGSDDEINCATAALFAALDDKDWFVGVAASGLSIGAEKIFFSTSSTIYPTITAAAGELMSVRYSSFFNVGASQSASLAAANVWTWNSAAASMSCYRGGAQQGTAVSLTGSLSGSQAYVGSRGALTFTVIKIYRMIVCSRALTAGELASATTWLGAGAGLTV